MVYLVGSGLLRSVKYSENGNKIWLADILPGTLVGEVGALNGSDRSAFVEAQDPSIVYGVASLRFVALMQAHAEIGLAISRLLARRVYDTSNQLTELTALSVGSRLHSELVRLGAPDPLDAELLTIKALPTVRALAQRIHTSRETASRALSELEQRGLVRRKDGGAQIVAPAEGG